MLCTTHLASLYSTDVDDEDTEEETEQIVKTFDDLLSGWFKFVQDEEGMIPAVYHDSAEDMDAINFKKQIAAAFQANFKGAGDRVESDPQSHHMAIYR